MTVDSLSGRYVDPRAGRVTVDEYVDGWAKGQPWRDSTRASREATLDARILPTFGKLPLASVRPSHVQAWIGTMSSEGLAPSSVEAYFRVLAQIFSSARRDRLIVESPCDDVRLPRRERSGSVKRVLSTEEVVRLAESVPKRYRALVYVSAALGLRQGEACGLTVDRIDFLRRTARIDRQIVTRGRVADASFGPPKTPSSTRTIPLPVSVAEILAEHLREFGEGPDRLVFTTKDGGVVNRPTWHSAFSAAADRAGIEASSHDLRHHAASLLISAGCSPRAVASFLGHRNAAETLNTYTHLWPTDEGRIVAAIEDGLGGSVREVCAEAVVAGS